MKKITYEFINNYIINLGFVLIDTEYKNNYTKLTIKDSENYLYMISLHNIKDGKYKPRRFDKSNPYTIQNIKLWCKEENKPFILLSEEYNGNKKKLQWKCLKTECNEIFEMKWNHIFRGINCPFCRGSQVGLSNCLATKNSELAKEWHPTLNGDLTPYDVTCGSHKEVWWQCKDNKKHKWMAKINNRNNGSNCPYCSGYYVSEDYNLLVHNPELCKEWDHIKNEKHPEEYTPFCDIKVWWICCKCGHNWDSIIRDRNNGSGCPHCNKSKGENEILEILKQKNIHYVYLYTFPDCKNINILEFDFYLPDYNICIEYQGLQHYEPVDFAGKGEEWAKEQYDENQKRDQIKRDYCNKNNIKLIEIPYWDFDKVEEVLIKHL